MARPKTIDNETIIEAARKLFLEKGFRVSTAEIAKAAGVSEGSIFNRFSTKEALFHSAMGIPQLDFEKLFEARVGQGQVEEQLTEIMLELVSFFRELMPRMMMLWAHPGMNPLELHRKPDTPPLLMLKAFTHYFDEEMRLGRIRSADPEVTARMCLGSVYNFVFFELTGIHVRMPISAHSYVRGLVDILWKGIGA
jgi:AcrR family transcriptional regulator